MLRVTTCCFVIRNSRPILDAFDGWPPTTGQPTTGWPALAENKGGETFYGKRLVLHPRTRTFTTDEWKLTVAPQRLLRRLDSKHYALIRCLRSIAMEERVRGNKLSGNLGGDRVAVTRIEYKSILDPPPTINFRRAPRRLGKPLANPFILDLR